MSKARNEVLWILDNEESTKLDMNWALNTLKTQEKRTTLISNIDEWYKSLDEKNKVKLKSRLWWALKNTLQNQNTNLLAEKILWAQYSRKAETGAWNRTFSKNENGEKPFTDEEESILWLISSYLEIDWSWDPKDIHMFLANNKIDEIDNYDEEITLEKSEDWLNISDENTETIYSENYEGPEITISPDESNQVLENQPTSLTDEQIENFENAPTKLWTSENETTNEKQIDIEQYDSEPLKEKITSIETDTKNNPKSELWKIISPNTLDPSIDMKKEMENELFREEMWDLAFTIGKEFDTLINENQEWLKDALSSTSYMTINRESLYTANKDGTLALTKTGETVRQFMESGSWIVGNATNKMVTDLKSKWYNNEKVLTSLDWVASKLKEIEQALSNQADVALFFAESWGKEIDQNTYSNQTSKENIQNWTSTIRSYSLEQISQSKNQEYINTLTTSVASPEDIANLYDEVSNNFNKYVLDWEIIYTEDPLEDEYINWDQVAENKNEIVKNQLHNWEIAWFSLSDLLTKLSKDTPNIHSLHRKELNNWSEEDHQELFKHMAWKESSFDDTNDWKVLKRSRDTFAWWDKLEKNIKKEFKKRKKWRLDNDDVLNINKIADKLQNTDEWIVMKNWVYHKNVSDDYDLDYYKVTYESGWKNNWEELFIHKDDMQSIFNEWIEFRKDNTRSETREDIALTVNQEELFYQQLGVTGKFLKEHNIDYKWSNWSEHTLQLGTWHTIGIDIGNDWELWDISYNLWGKNFWWEVTLYGEKIAQWIANIAFLDQTCQKLWKKYQRNKNKDQISDTMQLISNHSESIIWEPWTLSIKDDKLFIDDKEYTGKELKENDIKTYAENFEDIDSNIS